jgi:hypothetical protein
MHIVSGVSTVRIFTIPSIGIAGIMTPIFMIPFIILHGIIHPGHSHGEAAGGIHPIAGDGGTPHTATGTVHTMHGMVVATMVVTMGGIMEDILTGVEIPGILILKITGTDSAVQPVLV